MFSFINYCSFLKIGIFAYKVVVKLHEFYKVEYSTEKEFLISFGKNLRRLRKSKGFTQAQLAIDVGVEISQISRIERGVINTSIYMVWQISKVLKVAPQDFYSFK